VGENVVRKGEVQMWERRMERVKRWINWGARENKLMVMSSEEVRTEVEDGRSFFVLVGFIYNVKSFVDIHAGGEEMMCEFVGKDEVFMADTHRVEL
jgi:cytochrome b involved in lipid metabolism